MARLIEGVLKDFPDQRILIVIHVRELIEQQRDLVLIDEAHLTPRASNTMYRHFLDGLQRLNRCSR